MGSNGRRSSDEVRVLTPAGMLGYGFSSEAFSAGVALEPDVITVDSGSTDSGPQKLGLGAMTCSREAYVKDLSLLLEATAAKKIPLYVTASARPTCTERSSTCR